MTVSSRRATCIRAVSSPRPPMRLALTLFCLGTLACGPVESSSEPHSLGSQFWEARTTNGMSINGLATNGLATNGLATNGLATNGLANQEFSTWFESNPTNNAALMHYIVQCALPAGQIRTYTSSTTGNTYTWVGNLGLATDWANGAPATIAEQQVVSACLAAHANKYGILVPISVLGKSAKGILIPYTSTELTDFAKREACFFGNLFLTQPVIYVGNQSSLLDSQESTARACALSSTAEDVRTECSPLYHIGTCSHLCTMDSTRTYYLSCKYNNITYQPLTTRMRLQDVYKCGDGVCQFTEKCGTGEEYNNCKSDCGLCP